MPRANRRCPVTRCDQLAPCPEHTAAPWQTSNRRASLPGDWSTLRARILDRDPVCRLAYVGTWLTSTGTARCTRVSTDVDHIGSPVDHRPDNLRGVCHPCHVRRTVDQSRAGRGLGTVDS